MKHENAKPATESAVSAPAGFHDRLRQFAAQADITQRQIAEAIGVSRRTVEEWCAGRHEPQPYVQELILRELRATYANDALDAICSMIEKIEREEHEDGDIYVVQLRDGKWLHFNGMNPILRRFIFDNHHSGPGHTTITGRTEYTRKKG